MKAWRVHELGPPADVLRLEDVEVPEPGPGQVRVQVEAAGLNFADTLQCQGKYQEKPELPFTPGMELAGRVTAVGDGVGESLVGQRVMGPPVLGHGSLAEVTLMDAGLAFPVPESFPAVTAAAMYITYQTGHVALHRRGRLQPGETLLVHAGAGGVGSAAIQLGLAAGARVIATAGGADKVALCRELGAEIAIDYTAEDFVAVVNEATGGKGADVIYDPVGGETFDKSRKCINFEGRILVIGFAQGDHPGAPTNHALVKNYSVVGVHWALYNKRDRAHVHEVHADLLRLHGAGRIAPLVSRAVALADVPAGLVALANRGTTGKVVVVPQAPSGPA